MNKAWDKFSTVEVNVALTYLQLIFFINNPTLVDNSLANIYSIDTISNVRTELILYSQSEATWTKY